MTNTARRIDDIPPESNELRIESLAIAHASDLLNDGIAQIELPFSKAVYGGLEFTSDLDDLLAAIARDDEHASQKQRDMWKLKERLFEMGSYYEGDFYKDSVRVLLALTRQYCGTNVNAQLKAADQKALDEFAAMGKRLIDWAAEKVAEKEIGDDYF